MPAEDDLTWIASVDDAQSERIILTATTPPLGALESSPTSGDLGEERECDCDGC